MAALLDRGQVLGYPFVIGELATRSHKAARLMVAATSMAVAARPEP